MDSSLFTNTSLIIRVQYSEWFIFKGLLHPSPVLSHLCVSTYLKGSLITPQILAACHILNTEFLDANTQALLALMEVRCLHQGKSIHLETCSLPLIGNSVGFALADKIKMHCYLCGTTQVLRALL